MTTSAAPLSLWHDDAAVEWGPTTVLPGDREVDVAVVGAGYTGLWTAYYLAQADPTLRLPGPESRCGGVGAPRRYGSRSSRAGSSGSAPPGATEAGARRSSRQRSARWRPPAQPPTPCACSRR